MKAAIGRQLFFDDVAAGLMVALGSPPPLRIALKANRVTVPVVDMISLARAICHQHAGTDNVREANLSAIIGPLPLNTGWVIDGEQRPLRDIVEQLEQFVEAALVVTVHNIERESSEWPIVEYNPSQCADVLSMATQRLFESCGKYPHAQTYIRFLLRGFSSFSEDANLFDEPSPPDLSSSEATERLCLRLSSTWRYRDEPVQAEHIRTWLRQFDDAGFATEARELLVYLARYGYVTEQRIAAALKDHFEGVARTVPGDWLPVGFQVPGKSESKIAYKLRPEIVLKNARQAIEVAMMGAMVVRFVCFDDCIGSGQTFINCLFDRQENPESDELVGLFASQRATLDIIVYHCDPRGASAIENHPEAFGAIKVRTVCPLDTTHITFSEQSKIVQDPVRRIAFKAFCANIGAEIFPAEPLGWGNCQWCVSYDYSIPDNSLPILFASGTAAQPWTPLFPRARGP